MTTMLKPGTWLGIMGGGQLARMYSQAAQKMGYKVAVLEQDQYCPAGMVADTQLVYAYDDQAGLDALSSLVSAVSTEFENVPAASLKHLSLSTTVTPGYASVAVVQDRIAEKAFIASQGIEVAPYIEVRDSNDISHTVAPVFPGILKVARMGYDGKGQARVKNKEEAIAAFKAFGEQACVLEAMLPLKEEWSMVEVRALDGEQVSYPLVRNTHIDGILALTEACNDLPSAALQEQAQKIAHKIASGLNYFGVLCVEFFLLEDGRLVVNEIAPRPHNSGHYSINACETSQFEQQVRVMAGIPLGSSRLHSAAMMINLLGDVWFDEHDNVREPAWESILSLPGVSLHLYGKADARKARKMGHVTVIAESFEQVKEKSREVAKRLNIDLGNALA